ncbi:hypothetical protein Pcinc_035119 [Petrolisthes cinctipes]|uniref:Uncharacterized protein n=1 Tax=Petrolisthes cinctipes TaxID=88211 RepID=A0AAE1C1B4_PETCI|nr:hypothetical protein Pcinc_035119 [Petrolisthes cinctipes]
MTGKAKGQDIFIPRFPLILSDKSFEFKRLQFPMKLSYNMFINKVVGLTTPVFSHGQLEQLVFGLMVLLAGVMVMVSARPEPEAHPDPLPGPIPEALADPNPAALPQPCGLHGCGHHHHHHGHGHGHGHGHHHHG